MFTGRATIEHAMLPAGSGMLEYSRQTPEERDKLLEVMATMRPRFDHILRDTGAGISDVVLFTISPADEVLIVTMPEPTSLADAMLESP